MKKTFTPRSKSADYEYDDTEEQSSLEIFFKEEPATQWDEHPVNKKVYTTHWACPRQLTKGWGCPTILERMKGFFDKMPDLYIGLTDGIDDENATTVDINPDNNPTVVADWNSLPFKDQEYDFSFFDPPYDKMYLQGLAEILRVTKRRIAILHQITYPNPKGWHKIAFISISTGPKTRQRALQVYERDDDFQECLQE